MCIDFLHHNELTSSRRVYVIWDGSKVMLIGVHVDDGICISNDGGLIEEKLKILGSFFELKIIKDPEVFTGIQIMRNRAEGWMLLHQEKAVRKFIASIDMTESASVKTPMQVGLELADPSTIVMGAAEQAFPYQSAVGKLIWLLGVRLDCSFAINVATRAIWDAGIPMLSI